MKEQFDGIDRSEIEQTETNGLNNDSLNDAVELAGLLIGFELMLGENT